jgi:diguanylate cyclase (GGDEF)-like protein
VRAELTCRCADGASGARYFLPGVIALALLLVATCATAGEPEDFTKLLQKADSVKTANHAEFTAILKSLDGRSPRLAGAQQQYLRYLKAWNSVVEGADVTVIPTLKEIIRQSSDVTLQFRARSTLMNLQELTTDYEAAYSELSRLVQLLPRVSDKAAREQGLMNAAQLYRAVGQTDLSLGYAQTLVDENWAGRGVCRGGQQRLAALYESGRLKTVGAEVQAGTDACVKQGEFAYANEIRTHAAKLYIDQGRFDDAIALLKGHYDEVLRTQYSRLISEFEALLADAYRRKGFAVLARTFASRSVAHGMKSHYPDSSIGANLVLYELAKEQGDFKSALAFHEQYAAADKGYLDEVNARQLAYDKVTLETIANKQQIVVLNEQNQVLQLQTALGAEAVENSRLYIALLITFLVFIGLWAYRTKRSQLHFKSVSQLDGLTGICNRPHFISQAESALEDSRKSQQELCIVLCDLDHFKAINDRHGHATGDMVLQEMVSRCRVHLPANEVFARFGGEEFAILFPRCGPEAARLRAEQLRVAIAQIAASSEGVESRVSASFGIAATGSSGCELRQLLAHADAALYQAKRAGRNRVVLYDGSVEVDRPTVIALDERVLFSSRSSVGGF